ncbi:Transposable element P transposase [Frankliniella fusca]|uniref:Transposable element P transposase n=1 Tax=Frankliniella fusca TaxID=407009 RepID=A0AAE1LFN6_9NEOP|nr:Transposable element P transposase [Frankliniella fusca]
MYLSSLPDEIQKSNTCSGVRQYECLWRNSKGHIDTILFEETPCFRSLECLLFVNSYSDKRCGKCQAELRNFRKIMLRKEERIDKNASAESAKVLNKFLSPEELKEKAERLRKSKRQEKKRADRLKERLEKNKIKLDEYSHNDLLQIFMENQHKLTPEQRQFWEAQVNALKVKNKKNIHWDPVMIRLALHWQHQLGNTGYDSLRKFISLPCTRRLYDYSHVYKSKEGCQEEFLRDVKKLVEKSGTEKHFKYVNLMFDEMHIRSGLVISRSTGELIGYTNLSEVEVVLKRLTDKDAGVSANYRPSLAKKVLVYLAKGITSSVSDVVAVYTTDDSLLASQLYSRTWEVVYFLECADIHVLSLTFDGAPTNIKFIQMHGKYNEHDAFLYATNNLAAEEKRPIYFIVDPPHLLKTCRNCLANSFCHKKCRKLWKNGEEMSWEVFVQIYEFSKTMKFCDTKPTKAHIKLTSFSCMKVIYAVQIFSASVANFLEKYKTHETFQKYQINELVKFIRLMNRFFDCMNAKVSNKGSSKKKSSDTLPYSNVNDERFHFLTGEFLQYFDDWEEDVKKRLGFTKKEKQRMNLSHQFLHAIRITVHSFVSAIRFMINIGATEVNGQDFNQDLLEQYFSTMRAAGGANNNPGERQVHLTRAKIHAIGQQGVTTTKGNTLVQKRDCSLDSSPLPALKRTRK